MRIQQISAVVVLLVGSTALQSCQPSARQPSAGTMSPESHKSTPPRVLDGSGRWRWIAGANRRNVDVPGLVRPGDSISIEGRGCLAPSDQALVKVLRTEIRRNKAHHGPRTVPIMKRWVPVQDRGTWRTHWRVTPHLPAGLYSVWSACFQEPNYLQVPTEVDLPVKFRA